MSGKWRGGLSTFAKTFADPSRTITENPAGRLRSTRPEIFKAPTSCCLLEVAFAVTHSRGHQAVPLSPTNLSLCEFFAHCLQIRMVQSIFLLADHPYAHLRETKQREEQLDFRGQRPLGGQQQDQKSPFMAQYKAPSDDSRFSKPDLSRSNQI